MEIQFNLTEEDYVAFNMFHIKNSKTAMRALLIQRWIGPLIFITSSFLFSYFAELSFLLLLIIFSIFGVIWYFYYPKYFYNLILRQTKKFIKEGRNDGLIGDHHLHFSDEGIEDITVSGSSQTSWSGIKSFKEDDQNFYLYNTAVSAYIIPKYVLKNADEVRLFIKKNLVK